MLYRFKIHRLLLVFATEDILLLGGDSHFTYRVTIWMSRSSRYEGHLSTQFFTVVKRTFIGDLVFLPVPRLDYRLMTVAQLKYQRIPQPASDAGMNSRVIPRRFAARDRGCKSCGSASALENSIKRLISSKRGD